MSYSKLRFVRELRKYSQEFMAKKLSIPQNTYSTWEEKPDRIKDGFLDKIAEILYVSKEDLLSDLPFVINMNNNSFDEYTMTEKFSHDSQGILSKLCFYLEEQITLLKKRIEFLEKENDLLQKNHNPNTLSKL
jgi:transcriptional regulator with XRE-family HTH domain